MTSGTLKRWTTPGFSFCRARLVSPATPSQLLVENLGTMTSYPRFSNVPLNIISLVVLSGWLERSSILIVLVRLPFSYNWSLIHRCIHKFRPYGDLFTREVR